VQRLAWREATVASREMETETATTLMLDVGGPDGFGGFVAGQHVDVRLTAEDGYQAQRSYSIASAPEDERLAITVQRIGDGELSPWLTDIAQPGDMFELRGPIGGWFAWSVADGGPLYLVAGGSGLVPVMSMLRHRRARESDVPARLLLSARTPDDVLYRSELAPLPVTITYTRGAPAEWTGPRKRIDAELLGRAGFPPEEEPLIFVCGPTEFVETAADILVGLGHSPSRIRTERFG
jgi:ferredoxin-NADP reductase